VLQRSLFGSAYHVDILDVEGKFHFHFIFLFDYVITVRFDNGILHPHKPAGLFRFQKGHAKQHYKQTKVSGRCIRISSDPLFREKGERERRER
jgi:hypothetical protein